MTDGLEARDELIETLRVFDVTENWRESVLKGTEIVIGGMVVAPMLCNTLEDTRGTVMGAGLKKMNHQSYQQLESSDAYFEDIFELVFNTKPPPTPPPMAPATNRMERSSESQKVVGRKPRIRDSSTRREVWASSVAL